MPQIKREPIQNLNEKIIINLENIDYNEVYINAIKKAAKNINMPGFRKGLVPTSMVEKMYGNSIFFEEILKVAQSNLYEYIKNEKINIIYQPLLSETNLYQLKSNTKETINFVFEIGLEPIVDLEFLKNLNIDKYEVTIGDEAINTEVKYYQNYYAEHKHIEILDDKDSDYIKGIISIKGDDNEENKKPFNLFTKNIKEDIYKNKYTTLKEKTTFEFNFEEIVDDFKEKYLNSLTIDTKEDKSTINYIIEIEEFFKTIPHILNSELYKLSFGDKTEVTDEISFKNKIKEDIQKHYEIQAKNHSIHLLGHEIPNNYNFEVPKEFLKKWLESQSEQQQKETKSEAPRIYNNEELEQFYKYIQQTIFHENIIKLNNFNVTEDEIKEGIKGHVLSQFGQYVTNEDQLNYFVNNSLKDKKYVQQIEDNILNEKIYNYIFSITQKNIINVTEKEFVEILIKHNKEHHTHQH